MNSDYIINKKSKLEFEIHKFLHGEPTTTYIVRDGKCNCPSGRYRGYCKHKDWVTKLNKRQILPNNVEVSRTLTRKEMRLW